MRESVAWGSFLFPTERGWADCRARTELDVTAAAASTSEGDEGEQRISKGSRSIEITSRAFFGGDKVAERRKKMSRGGGLVNNSRSR
jgi:hypothetical protein